MIKLKISMIFCIALFASLFFSISANASTIQLVNKDESMWVWMIEKSQNIKTNMENRFLLRNGESRTFNFDGQSEKDFARIRIYYETSWTVTTTVCDVRVTPNDTLTPILVENMNASMEMKKCYRTSFETVEIK